MRTCAFDCHWLLTPAGWQQNVRIAVDEQGLIDSIDAATFEAGATVLAGPVVPGMINVHSHAHQRLIAGLTGRRGPSDDSFWSWRELMYGAIELLDSEQLGLVASWLYMELLEGGYTSIGEFHYPHKLQGSTALSTSKALLAAANRAGCALTLLPVWYQYAGFGRQPPTARQNDFVLSQAAFADLLLSLQGETAGSNLQMIGMAPHSLRAVDVDDLPAVLARFPDLPVHVHVAEQLAEVDACLAHSGQRPIELLASRVEVDARWCLIHATHASDSELKTMADVQATVGLCPTTEADLGDGLFPVREFLELGGRIAIGSDSNLVTSAGDELRMLEWGQRLVGHRRNVLVDQAGGHIGSGLWSRLAVHGARAIGQPAGALAPGRRADFVVLDNSHPLLAGLAPDAQLDTAIMTGRAGMIDQVYVAGQQRVAGGVHPGKAALNEPVTRLRQRLSREVLVS